MMKWYAVRALSGKEKQVAERIEYEAKMNGLDAYIEEVLVPTENVVEMREGKKRTRTKVFFPGYILVKMELTSETEYFLENTSGIMSFVGPKGQPAALPDNEVRRIIGEVEEKEGREVMATPFREGDPVKIVDGPFVEFTGVVKEVNVEKHKLKVEVSIFGRSTPVEFDYLQVELEK